MMSCKHAGLYSPFYWLAVDCCRSRSLLNVSQSSSACFGQGRPEGRGHLSCQADLHWGQDQFGCPHLCVRAEPPGGWVQIPREGTREQGPGVHQAGVSQLVVCLCWMARLG